MCNTGGQLAHGSQALLLHHTLLRVLQLLQCIFESMVAFSQRLLCLRPLPFGADTFGDVEAIHVDVAGVAYRCKGQGKNLVGDCNISLLACRGIQRFDSYILPLIGQRKPYLALPLIQQRPGSLIGI